MLIEERETPLVTLGLIAVNVMIFIIMVTNPVVPSMLFSKFSLIPYNILRGKGLITLLTSMFIHSNLMHIFLNMISLLIFGPELERAFGRLRFSIIYFLSGISAGLVHTFYVLFFLDWRALLIPTVGASGAVFGILASYAVMFPFRRLMVFFYFPIIAPAFLVIGGIALIQILMAISQVAGQLNIGIAFAAHVGGFVAGLLMTLKFRESVRRKYWYIAL